MTTDIELMKASAFIEKIRIRLETKYDMKIVSYFRELEENYPIVDLNYINIKKKYTDIINKLLDIEKGFVEECIKDAEEEVKERVEKEKEEIKENEKREELDYVMNKFIFDEEKVMKVKPFNFLKITNNTAGFGVFLPKEIELKNSKGKFLGTEQIFSPTIITTLPSILEVRNNQIKDHNIRFEAIPGQINRRWSLYSIKKFLKSEYGKIDGIKLFHKIRRIYEKYMYYQSDVWYSIHAIWDMGTYFFMLFQAFPIFELRGLKRTAKTKTMSISSYITLNSTGIMVNPSEATLFRETHDKRPTKYIDEAENLFTFSKGRIIQDSRVEVINSSYYFNATVPRVEKIGNKFITVYYHTYSPTMVGSINGLYGATEDRAIIHITVKVPNADSRGELEPADDSEEWESIRDELYVYSLQNWKEIETIYLSMENDTKLKSRDYQIWKPILSISKYIGEEIYNDIVKQAEKATEIKDMNSISEGSLDYKIIKILLQLLNKEDKKTKQIILNKDIRANLPGEDKEKPAPKTITKHIESFGFRDFSKHTREGNGWEISYEDFETLINPIFSSLSSLSSLYTENNEDTVNVSEEKVESVKNGCEGCEANEANEGEMVSNSGKVNLPCYICNDTPSYKYEDILGKPICYNCYKTKQAQK